MKKLTQIFILLFLIWNITPMKAQKYYDQQWKKISENYKKGTYKSNLPLILDIQKRAISEDNAIQLIKSLKAELSVIDLTEDDTQNDTASQFFKKLQSFDQKLKGEQKYCQKSGRAHRQNFRLRQENPVIAKAIQELIEI